MKIRLLLFFLILSVLNSYAQTDTLSLSVEEAEKVFLQNNLSLVASKYNIDATTALIRQARLWDNPVLLTDQTLYDGKFFRHSKLSNGTQGGEVYLQMQQLIKTAGKIRKLSTLAGTNARISELQFEQVMHNLHYSVRNDLYQSNRLFLSIQLFEREKEQVRTLLAAMNAQLQAGNISQKDFLRIQSLNVSLLQEENGYRQELSDVQSELHTLLQLDGNSFIKPVLSGKNNINPLNIDSLLVTAKETNPDYLLEKANLLYSQNALDYQQALRKPDVTVGVEYDKINSYVPNYYGLTLALPLPLINRNQGAIASAAFTMKQEQALVNQKEFKLLADIQNALNKVQLSLDLEKNIDPDFIRKYDVLMRNAFNAYQQRQINLLDFLDLFDAYKNTQLQYLQQQYNLQKTKEDLNLLIGKDVIN